jgi:hypothetical protein
MSDGRRLDLSSLMLITESYREMQHELHRNARYGAASMKFAYKVNELIAKYQPERVLDYGAGKRLLRTAIGNVDLVEYDPCIPEISKVPTGTFDLVCCLDVLEHIEPECLESVLADVARLTAKIAFLTIHTGPAGKFLSDGRNAHLIQKPIEWWSDQLSPRFARLEIERVSKTTYSVIGWR